MTNKEALEAGWAFVVRLGFMSEEDRRALAGDFDWLQLRDYGVSRISSANGLIPVGIRSSRKAIYRRVLRAAGRGDARAQKLLTLDSIQSDVYTGNCMDNLMRRAAEALR